MHNNIEYKIIPLTEETIINLEKLRYNAYNIDKNILLKEESYYHQTLKTGKYLVFACYLNNNLIGACYVTNTYNTLYIDQLFIKKEYQKTNLHLGTNLLKYILKHKHLIEKYFNTTFTYSYADPKPTSINICKSLGYEETNFNMKKRL